MSEAAASLKHQPSVFINASAVGYYGNQQNELLTEDSRPGKGFLPEVCRQWERAVNPAQQAGIRIVKARMGVVLSQDGGALQKMLPVFKLGLGGILGSGQQYFPWVDLFDAVSAIEFALRNADLSGPVNIVAPNPVTNAEFTHTLSRMLSRPAIFPVPAVGLKLIMGEMAEEMLLSSTRVDPEKLKTAKFEFKYPLLEQSLHHLLQ